MQDRRVALRIAAGAFMMLLTLAARSERAAAEASEIRIAQTYGIASLPLVVAEHEKLIEKHARKLGLGEVSVKWLKFSGGNVMNEALLSGSLDVAAAGTTPLLIMWDKTASSAKVKGIAALGSLPLVLVTSRPGIKSVKDFTAKDKIAMPAAKVSLQAVFLQMAVAAAFGDEAYDKLDPITISMRHVDAMTALMGGLSEVTGHVSTSPYFEQELKSGKVFKVTSSVDVMGPATNVSIYSTSKFYDSNPKLMQAVVAALSEATDLINADKRRAAEIYRGVTNEPFTIEFLVEILSNPDNKFTIAPEGIEKYADFMYSRKLISRRPASWKDVFFPAVHNLPGS